MDNQNNNFSEFEMDHNSKTVNDSFNEMMENKTVRNKSHNGKEPKNKNNGDNKKLSKGMKILTIVLSVYIAIFTGFVGWWYIASSSYEKSIAREFEITDKILFYQDNLFDDRISVNGFEDNEIIFNIFEVPEIFKEATIEGLEYVESTLQIFDFVIVDSVSSNGVAILPMEEDEKGGDAKTKVVGLCRFGKKGYDFIEHKYDINNTEIRLNYEVFERNREITVSGDPFMAYKNTLAHETIHAVLYAKDITSTHPYYEDAESIMSYHKENRTMVISDFDMKNIIEPQIVNTLLRNKELVEFLDYNYNKIVAYALSLEEEYLK